MHTEREVEIFTVPGLVYTSRKSPAAIEKSPKVGRSHGLTSGMLICASWSSYDQVLENWWIHGQMVNALMPLVLQRQCNTLINDIISVIGTP